MHSAASKKRFAAFIRVSTEEQGEHGKSLKEQRENVLAIVANLGGNAGSIRIYGGAESASRDKARPEFERLLTDARAKKFDALVVTSIDRLSRNPEDQLLLFKVCETQRVDVYVGRERMDFHSAGQQIGLMVQTMASHFETQSRLDSSARGRIRLAARGFPSSGGPPFGRSVPAKLVGNRKVFATDKDDEAKWQIDSDAKRYVQRAAKLYLAGNPWPVVAEKVTWPADSARVQVSRRANTVRRRVLQAGGDWEQVFKLRRNDERNFSEAKNLERIRFEGDRAVVSTPVPPLLDADTLRRVRAKAQARYIDRRLGTTYTLSRFLRCQVCRSSLGLHTHPNGSVYIQHHPLTRTKHCVGSFGRYEPLEVDVLYQLDKAMNHAPSLIEAVRKVYSEAVPERAELESRRLEVEEELARTLTTRERLRRNLATVDLADEDAKALGEESKRLSASVQRLEAVLAEVKEQLDLAIVPKDIEIAVKETVDRLRYGHPLLHGTPETKREAAKALFGTRPVRNRPKRAKKAPPFGVFLRMQKDHDVGPLVAWTAHCQFVVVGGALTNVPEVAHRYAILKSPPGAGETETTEVVSEGLNVSKHAYTRARWSRKRCVKTPRR